MKVKTLAEAVARYGQIDFEHLVWPERSKWIQPIAIPADMFPHWTVCGSKLPVHLIYANIDMHKPLQDALAAVKSAGLDNELKSFDGCFNIRMVRGSLCNPSAHSYGLAIDLNASENPLGSITTRFSSAFIKCFTDQGFDWGGNFKHRRDCMHYSFCWE